jgi:hypothetical protein
MENPMLQDDVRVGERVIDDVSEHRVRVTDRLLAEHIDGAWWPPSTDLTNELPAQLTNPTAPSWW